jgi:hypothetical protein
VGLVEGVRGVGLGDEARIVEGGVKAVTVGERSDGVLRYS